LSSSWCADGRHTPLDIPGKAFFADQCRAARRAGLHMLCDLAAPYAAQLSVHVGDQKMLYMVLHRHHSITGISGHSR
jgi:hypothetical protein